MQSCRHSSPKPLRLEQSRFPCRASHLYTLTSLAAFTIKPVALPQANPLTLRHHEYACARRLTREMPRRMPRALHLWHLASLDAPTVAVVWTIAFSSAAGVHLDTWVLLLIACGTWCVYVGDRLLDAQRAMRLDTLDYLRERHYFHWHHRRWLIPCACTAAAIAALLIVGRMSSAVRHRDSVLAAAALLYFSGVHSTATLPHWIRKRISKEFLVGLLFTAGCSAPTLARLPSVGWPLIVCLTSFAALAWLNCSAIERWESSDLMTGISSRSSILSIVFFASAAAMSFVNTRTAGMICIAGISATLLTLLDLTRRRISTLTLRTLADMMLLTPLILLALTARLG